MLSACGTGALERLADEPLVPTSSIGGQASAEPPPDVVTQSPWPIAADADPRGRELARACGEPDGGLERVARAVALTRAKGLGAPDGDRVAVLLRSFGVPHVRPRVLAASGRAPLEDADLRTRLATLAGPLARCGVAIERTPHGGEIAVAVAVDALADLAPLPQHARPGEWLSVEAKLHVTARSARVLVTGPRGMPRAVPAQLDRTGTVRARFALERPGAFLVQVVGDVEGGPRPLLEAKVGTEKVDDEDAPAPGEDAATGEDAGAMERMVIALRATENLPPLSRDPRLDALARAHAAEMAREGVVAHDVGKGDLRVRAGAANLVAQRVGENVAHAATLARAFRALHASPSHRVNLLDAGYTRMGLGVVRAEDGSFWVCQVFGTD